MRFHHFTVTNPPCGERSPPVADLQSGGVPPQLHKSEGAGKRARCIALLTRQCYKTEMDKTIRRYDSFAAVKDAEYREWQALPVQVRLDAAAELSLMQFQGKDPARDVQPGLQRTLVRVPRIPR
jgi:hypothetical protein